MRDLAKSDKNILEVHDKLSGTDMTIYYRTPTTQERISFNKRLIKRVGKKVVDQSAETMLEDGLKIITGFKDGDFGIDGKPISSNPESPDYYPEWKRLLEEEAADVAVAVANTVFNSARTGSSDIDIADADEGAKETLPLPKS